MNAIEKQAVEYLQDELAHQRKRIAELEAKVAKCTAYAISRDTGRIIGDDHLHVTQQGMHFAHHAFNQGTLFVASKSVCEEIARAIGNCTVVKEPL